MLSPRPRRLFTSRSLIILLPIALITTYLLVFHISPIVTYHVLPQRNSRDGYTIPAQPPSNKDLSVNLVIASTSKASLAWTSDLHRILPNLKILPYISDDSSAQYHPPAAKGREALVYFTYLHDFYDSLPDISIFIHHHELAWHVDNALMQNTTFALAQLDLAQVQRRGYFNLRTSWLSACPAWINTTKTVDESEIQEEAWMGQAFRENFGQDVQVPEILAGPCCSQFAVTRDAIRSRPKAQYARSRDWLLNTNWDDYFAGRVWERMWPWLFQERAIDCAVEWKSLCRMYGVCFERGDEELRWYNAMWEEMKVLEEATELWNELLYPQKASRARSKIKYMTRLVQERLEIAVARGRDPGMKGIVLGDMYSF